MRALVRVPGGVALAEQPDPRAAADEVLISVHSCGICGSDVHAAEANTSIRGGIPGHELAGTIAEVGAEVTDWRVGQPAAINPLGSCGSCELCKRGMPIRCTARPNLGLSASGGFAEFVRVHQSQLFALAGEVPLEHGSRVEPLAVGVRAIVEAKPAPGDNAIVFGVGPIGLHLIMALRAMDAGTIVAVGRSSEGRRRAAAAIGADVVLDSRETDVAEYVRAHGIEVHEGYECSADPQALVILSHAVKAGGALLGLALGWSPAAFDTHAFVAKGQRMFGVCAYGYQDFQHALDLISSGAVNVEPLITERVSLADGPDAFARLRHPGNLVSVLVQPWR